MLLKLSECVAVDIGPPQFVLNMTTELMRFYPLFMKASMVLQRLVQ